MLKVLASSLLLFGFLASTGCSAPVESDEADSANNALAADETVAATLLSDIPSASPRVTGVDTWRLSLVMRPGSTRPYLVAIGSAGREDKLDVVLGVAGDERSMVQLITKEEVAPDDSFLRAIGEDLRAIEARYAASEMAEAESTEATTSSVRIQAAGDRVGDMLRRDKVREFCVENSKSDIKAELLFTGALLLISAAETAVMCGGAAMTGGATAGFCVYWGAGTVAGIRKATLLIDECLMAD